MDIYTAYSIVDSHIYVEALTEEEVAEVYADVSEQILSYKDQDLTDLFTNKEIYQLDDLSVYEPITEGAVHEIEGLPSTLVAITWVTGAEAVTLITSVIWKSSTPARSM